MNTKRTEIHKAFLQLVRLGIGMETVNGSRLTVHGSIGWPALKDLAERQGLGAVVIDGIEKLRTKENDNLLETAVAEQATKGRANYNLNLPDKLFLLEWIGETLQGYEYRYEQYRKTIGEMAALYNAHGLKMMVLKGFACSLDWPRPEHRPCGDIDIWQFGRYREGDKLVASEKGIEIDSSHHHHTVFYWGEFMVENHYDFINVYGRKANVRIEKIYKELGSEANLLETPNGEQATTGRANKNDNQNPVGTRIKSIEVCGEKVYLPSANLHALFLMRHLVSHFVGAYISLRQVLDWAFFVEKHGKDVDWEWLEGVLEEFGITEFYNIINAICVEDLGFDVNVFHGVQFNPQSKARVLNDILCPKFGAPEPMHLIPRAIFKFRRWQGNGWKHELCFKQSRWKNFWTLLRSHLMKPEV